MTTPSIFTDGPIERSRVPRCSALEHAFPVRQISLLAERESWRKEVQRPASHTHKWWAQRLGTVFRGILAAAVSNTEEETLEAYNGNLRLSGLVVLDPFAGSGTTLVEGAKSEATVIGRDINPVAALVARQALSAWDRNGLASAFKEVEGQVRREIDQYYKTERGEPVLYYFWVALADCPRCDETVELFSSRVFAKHAYRKRFPIARALCSRCQGITRVKLAADAPAVCEECGLEPELQGPVNGAWMACDSGHRSRVREALGGSPPRMRMYAKQVLGTDGSRRYEPVDAFDQELYDGASRALARQVERLLLPTGQLQNGYNTRQAMGWGYARWQDFFNSRQLLCLGLISSAVAQLPHSPEREALAALLSGTLEFNNLFCSFKGEGTGAVRHMFSHHILKPERTPLEAHPWGTPASSGSFSTLWDRRLLRALEYKDAPHDLVLTNGEVQRVQGLSAPLDCLLGTAVDAIQRPEVTGSVSVGSSANFELPDNSVDLVITDPPFFDNVHYSELADFFHSWLRHIKPFPGYPDTETTRHSAEVQSGDPERFGAAIQAVWRECARILKADGLLAFTFHQARVEGWVEVIKALKQANLVVTAIQPVKAEMSTSSTKSAAMRPSNLDSIVVCRPKGHAEPAAQSLAAAEERALDGLRKCADGDITIGYGDVLSVVRGSVLSLYSSGSGYEMEELAAQAEESVARVAQKLEITEPREKTR